MDPNVTLRKLRAALQRGAAFEAEALFVALDDWLSDGGFLPDAWSIAPIAARQGQATTWHGALCLCPTCDPTGERDEDETCDYAECDLCHQPIGEYDDGNPLTDEPPGKLGTFPKG